MGNISDAVNGLNEIATNSTTPVPTPTTDGAAPITYPMQMITRTGQRVLLDNRTQFVAEPENPSGAVYGTQQ